ncbi:MAG TPA: DUF4255 domain-containing protein [Chitinophagaceae bacterium]
MIYEVLNFLRHNLDAYINNGRAAAEPVMVLSNPWSNNDSTKNFSFLNSISLINVEEERIFKTQGYQYIPKGKDRMIQREPDIKLNLYVLFSAYNKNYEDALKITSKVIGYFQTYPVFQKDHLREGVSTLPDGIDKLIVELYSASFEQQNQIWASMSTGYLPSVIYKIRMLVIDTAKDQAEMPTIQEIDSKIEKIDH